ncbi:PfkB family carbohydrate kinase [Kribbella sp. VKM Ac-2566]|uniref:PfkB family carbohydrate kinase n=1 Tax=Kribbella sp. VKM Ac-2566 TaxID=2512218 RepID=UPI001062A9D9|nr:PfkB family carbohydrate kinase [Kribbella sp. VKM Ac-2566]TDW86189.1 ribokinase [Kribbella sp. VKM Ac-2566]
MFDPLVQGLPNDSYLAPVFLSLRGHDGVTPKRLAASGIAQNLLRLPIVQNKAVQTGNKPADAAFAVIVEQVAQLESPTDRLIADAILNLGIYRETYKSRNISGRAIHRLTTGGVGDRRLAVVDQWQALHEALDAAPPAGPAPGEHTLRSRLEREVFERLSTLLVNPRPTFEISAPGEPIAPSTAQTVDATAAGKVIVVGGAAFDHTWRIGSVPPVGTSTMAMAFARTPGGKGVSQAVAAAHLDLDVSLIAAVARDDDGREIEAHLEREGVDTSLLHRVERPSARTPATGIYELPYGNSSAAVFRDIDLDVPTIDRHAAALTTCDVLLLTFELPMPVLKHVLDLVADAPNPPVVIVTPGQPYSNGHLVSPLLKQMDYLVAHLWELEGFAFSDEAKYDPELLSDDLLSRGLRSLCLLSVPDGGSVYERGKPTAQIPRPHRNIQEASITRDAFCAALAARLIEDRSRTENTFLWAAAAMASFADNYHQAPTTHPSRATINERFAQMPRGEAS